MKKLIVAAFLSGLVGCSSAASTSGTASTSRTASAGGATATNETASTSHTEPASHTETGTASTETLASPQASTTSPGAPESPDDAGEQPEPPSDATRETPEREPIDHRSLRCAWGRTPHALPISYGPGVLEHRWRISPRLRTREGTARMRPGQTLRIEHTIRNTGATPHTLTEAFLAQLLDRDVWLGQGNPELPLLDVQTPSPVAPGDRIAPGASLRVCMELRLPETRLDAFAGDQRSAVFRLAQLRDSLILSARYPPERGSEREPSSWGGIVRLRLAEGASLLAICREEGLRAGMGTGGLLHGSGDGGAPGAVWVQVPRSRSVMAAVARLQRRADVLAATPIEHGDPGTEGCGAYNPCGPGQVCCSGGAGGSAPSCFSGSTCPPVP